MPGDYVLQKNVTSWEHLLAKLGSEGSPFSQRSPSLYGITCEALDCQSLVHFYSSFQALESTSPLLLQPQNATSSRKTSLTISSLPICSGIRWPFLSCNPGLFLPPSGCSRASDPPPSRHQRMRTLEKLCHSNALCSFQLFLHPGNNNCG